MPLKDINGNINDKDLDDNFQFLLDEINNIKSSVSGLEINSATKDEIIRQADLLASNILNDTAGVDGAYVDNALLGLKNRIDNIIAQSGTSDTEVVDARYSPYYDTTNTVLTDRITNVENEKAEETMITNSFHADPQKYYGNVKTIDDFQDISEWEQASGSLLENLTKVKIGDKSIRIQEDDNTGNVLYAVTQNRTFDLSVLNNGESSTDNDYIIFVFYVSNIDKLQQSPTTIRAQFSSGALWTSNDRKVGDIPKSDLVTGWNYIKIKKSDFTTTGSATWENLQSLRLEVVSTDNAIGNYVSFQLIQLVKKDPTADYPNPFQVNGDRDFAINSGEWFVGEEFGKIVIRDLGTVSYDNGLSMLKSYYDFTLSAIFEHAHGSTNYHKYIRLYYDSNNYILIGSASSINDFNIYVVDGGDITYNETASINLEKGDIISFDIIRKARFLKVYVYKNGDKSKPYILSVEFDKSLDLALDISRISTRQFNIDSLSITEISHAHHADIAETAKSLVKQPYIYAYMSGNQSIPNATETDILFDVSDEDSNGMLTLNTDGTISINESGRYVISGNVRFNSQSTGTRKANLRDQTYSLCFDSKNAVSDDETELVLSSAIKLEEGDSIKVKCFQNSGASLALSGSYRDFTHLVITKVGE